MNEFTLEFPTTEDKQYFECLVLLGFDYLKALNPQDLPIIMRYRKLVLEQMEKDKVQEAEIVEEEDCF